MCCEDIGGLPQSIDDMLSRYREGQRERGFDWAGENGEWGLWRKDVTRITGLCDQRKLYDAFATVGTRTSGDLQGHVWDLVTGTLPHPLPVGLAIESDGVIELRDLLPFVGVGHRPVDYLVISGSKGSGRTLVACQVAADAPTLEINGQKVIAAEPVPMGSLRVRSGSESRWSVVDEHGGAWFPDRAIRKFDYHGRPYFHGNDLVLAVPCVNLTVSVGRGSEFRTVETQVGVVEGREELVELHPERLFDSARRGWYSGDLHVHLNWTSDNTASLDDAARMQRGEGLHFMNLLAANAKTSLIYDQEAFDYFMGQDLPWSNNEMLARWGFEYRNDMLGHLHVINPGQSPRQFQGGHPRSDFPLDWPTNATTIRDLKDQGATIGYAHPILSPVSDDAHEVFDDFDRVDWSGTRPEARELVTDAAVGLVDSMELAGNHDGTGGTSATENLYHRLLGCGIKLAATAGSDVILSHSRNYIPGSSNPPGWSRVYANLGDAPLTVEAWQKAICEGRTFATNGPWLEIDVNGRGPGETFGASSGDRLVVHAASVGVGVGSLEIVGPSGVMATIEPACGEESNEVSIEIDVEESMWIAAIARGSFNRAVPGRIVYAHTSPVWVEVGGRPVARARDAQWCLAWVDRFEDLVRTRANLSDAGQLNDFIELIGQSREYYRGVISASAEGLPDTDSVEKGN